VSIYAYIEVVRDRNNPVVLHLHGLFQDLYPSAPPPVRCLNCGDTNHTTADCSNNHMRCTNCGRKGHIVKACRFPAVPVRVNERTVISAPHTAAACSDSQTKYPTTVDTV
jgi:hypothetical protein